MVQATVEKAFVSAVPEPYSPNELVPNLLKLEPAGDQTLAGFLLRFAKRDADFTDKWRYILKHEDDYVERIESTGLATVLTHFIFTKDRTKAKVFTFQDLYWKQAIEPVGIAFSHGFSTGEVIRIDEKKRISSGA